MRGELRSSVGYKVCWTTVFGEDVPYEDVGKFLGGNGGVGRYEDCHVRESIDDHEDRVVAIPFG